MKPSRFRVSIRPPNHGDCDAFITAVRRSRALHRKWINPKAKTRAEFDKYLKRYSPASETDRGFFIFHKQAGALVGVINLNNVVRVGFQCAAVGYYAFVPHAGQGLMREGLMLVLEKAFRKLKLHRIEANIQPENRASIALAKNCGFVKEGFSRRFVKVCGRWKDHERWAILAEDFAKARSGSAKVRAKKK